MYLLKPSSYCDLISEVQYWKKFGKKNPRPYIQYYFILFYFILFLFTTAHCVWNTKMDIFNLIRGRII